MSVQRSILVWENLQQYTELYDLKLKNLKFDPSNHTSLNEDLYRYKIDCPVCEKGFKNSSFMLYHYYRNHLTNEEIESIIELNYMCSFIDCDKKDSDKREFDPVKFRQCLMFAEQYLEPADVDTVEDFCEFLTTTTLYKKENVWAEFKIYWENLLVMVFWFLTALFEYNAFVYILGSEKRGKKNKKKQQRSEGDWRVLVEEDNNY